ncbi:MAG: LPS export ABC transporter periplasmic protein LptC [Terriglobales bacterium]
MPPQISRLRRWFALAAIFSVVVVGGMYLYARHKVQNALKQVPEKMGLEIQQTATGFSISKSEQGRTLFRVEASKALQFKDGRRAELSNVEITLYGRDSSRFDQIYGKNFEYDQQSGDVIGKGEVEMDLQANPGGVSAADQASPKELKNPIHLKTTNLTFNQNTGDARTAERVDFRVPQASGSAVGVTYNAKTNVLTMLSQVNIMLSGTKPATVTAIHGTITRDPRIVVLDHAHLVDGLQQADADEATMFLRPDNTVDHVFAHGNVLVESKGEQPAKVQSSQLELLMASQAGDSQRSTLHTAIFTGDVRLDTEGPQPMQGTAGRAILDFAESRAARNVESKSVLKKIHAEENVKLLQHQKPSSGSATPQDFELTAPVVDFYLADGRHFERAETAGPPQMVIRPTAPSTGQQTVVTAEKFEAKFDDLGQLASVHGAPAARIVNSAPGQPDRLSTSNSVDAALIPGRGVQTIVQQGNVAYADGERQAWGDKGRYTPADQILTLTGSSRVIDKNMTTTARTMRMNRATGDAFADGDVKSTYSDLKPQPNGSLLASSSPIHVTARSMTAHRTPSVALYTGDARLWQDDNLVEAPSIEFDRDRRYVTAHSSASQKVSTVLVQPEKNGQNSPVLVTSDDLNYSDNDRKAHFEGNVVAKGTDATVTASRMDVFLQARGQTVGNQPVTSAGKIDHIVAQENVVITQPDRRGTGDQLVYTSADDKFVLTGGPPSIFDAEHGKITGVSLTLFRHDDRVLVEGNNQSPTVTNTRVAR